MPSDQTKMTVLEATAHFLLMARGNYETPEAMARGLMKRLAFEGFAVVPREATAEMIAAAPTGDRADGCRGVWAAMVESADKEGVRQ